MATFDTHGSNSVHKVFIVDDHPMMLRGYRALLVEEMDFVICGEAQNPGEAIGKIEQACPDLVITDLSMSGIGGFELIKNLHQLLPMMPILVSSSYEKELYQERVCKAGASGYIQKCDFLNDGLNVMRSLLI